MTRDYRRRLTKVIKAICSYERFTEFYKSLAKSFHKVKILFTKRLVSNNVSFELKVIY